MIYYCISLEDTLNCQEVWSGRSQFRGCTSPKGSSGCHVGCFPVSIFLKGYDPHKQWLSMAKVVHDSNPKPPKPKARNWVHVRSSSQIPKSCEPVLVALATCALIWEVHPGGPQFGCKTRAEIGDMAGRSHVRFQVCVGKVATSSAKSSEHQKSLSRQSQFDSTAWWEANRRGKVFRIFIYPLANKHSYG